MNETIFALSTGLLPAAIAIVRVSGPKSRDTLELLTGSIISPKKMVLRNLNDPFVSESDYTKLDSAMVVWFPAPSTYTGEDLVEFHLHGGRSVVNDVLETISKIPGLRPAERGEFTKRALLNGRIDLVQAEAIEDLILAETTQQRKLANKHIDCTLSFPAELWRQQILEIFAKIEGALDFVDEEDVPDSISIDKEAKKLCDEIRKHVNLGKKANTIRSGIKVALVGKPNVGKSSLLNCLSGKDMAIVSKTEGTTRDIIEVRMDISGWPVILADTAGIRETSDEIELQGVNKTRLWIEESDLIIHVIDSSNPQELKIDSDIEVWNKVDLVNEKNIRKIAPITAILLSCITESGIDELLKIIENKITSELSFLGSAEIPLTRTRHISGLNETADALEAAVNENKEEIIAEYLRRASYSLGRITGRIDIEEILDSIFSNFCIGK